MRETSSAENATFTVSGTTESKSSMQKRNSSVDSATPCASPRHSGAESPVSPFIWTLAVRFDRKLRNQWAKGIGWPLDGAASRSSSLQTRSKALEKSRKVIGLPCGLAAWKPALMVCVILRIWFSQERSLRKPACSLQNKETPFAKIARNVQKKSLAIGAVYWHRE